MPELITNNLTNDAGLVLHQAGNNYGGISHGTILIPAPNKATGNAGGNGITLDTTHPPTMATYGTAGQSQVTVMQCARASASTPFYINVVLPNDFSAKGDMNLYVYWFCQDNTTTKTPYWDTTWRGVHPTGTAVLDAAGTAGTECVTPACPSTAYRLVKSKIACPASVLAGLKPGDHLLIQVYNKYNGANVPGYVLQVPYCILTYARA